MHPGEDPLQPAVLQFIPGRIDYAGSMALNYNASRHLSPETANTWRDVILRHKPAVVFSVLDLGSGTGRFSGLLADWLGAVVLAVEPAKEMRAKALEGALRPNVIVIGGHAEELPLLDTSVDLAWLGFMIHHVVDRNSCARELTRVVRPNGVILSLVRRICGRHRAQAVYQVHDTARFP
jgi:ubiquinone/menaquinone biosynthesis C-methylase UbiE